MGNHHPTMNVAIVVATTAARASTFAQGQAVTDGSFFICHRQPLSGNGYHPTSRVSLLCHPNGVEGYNTERCCHGSHHASP
ncbi:unnamed protein product [Prunus armeniaca]|uniref:Uncharacterized protein n=1 Tax=Prunus armeniaca TaxID=36596 RepID=A0A6J5TRX8_PRUAR|nr:unnamed protein product [Prunus armeniaca]